MSRAHAGYDVIVVGAGPAGSTAARLCAETGLSTLLIEEHATIGLPVQCAGLLSISAFAECEVSDRPVLHRVKGARLISGLGSEFTFRAQDTKAYVVDRGALDREIAEAAAHAGVDLMLKTAVCGLRNQAVITRGINGMKEIPFRLLIAADGPRSTIARFLKMERARVYLSGIQADVPFGTDPDLVELHPSVSPEFFGWVIPIGNRRARVGLCGCTNVKEKFSKFVQQFGESTLHLVTGTLPLGVMPRTYGHRTLFVGDAAGFAKPTSGGGVYTGIRSARHAAAVAATCCECRRYDDTVLAGYEQRWQADIGRELALGFRLYQIRQQLSVQEIDTLCRAMNDPEVIEAIAACGDMDRPSRLVKELMKKPALFRCMGILLRSGMKALFA